MECRHIMSIINIQQIRNERISTTKWIIIMIFFIILSEKVQIFLLYLEVSIVQFISPNKLEKF